MAAAAKAATLAARFLRRASHRRHLIFGANTDVGKTLTSAGLVRASLMQDNSDNTSTVHYIKPLQCGGSDEGFIEKHCMPNITNNITSNNRSVAGSTTSNNNSSKLQCQTLFSWETPASPHIASRQENIPRSDKEVLGALDAALVEIVTSSNPPSSPMTTTWIETAGGVLSPSSASADNQSPYHASSSYTDTNNSNGSWGWLTQGDLYKPLSESASVVLCGDGRLGGKNEWFYLWMRRRDQGEDAFSVVLPLWKLSIAYFSSRILHSIF